MSVGPSGAENVGGEGRKGEMKEDDKEKRTQQEKLVKMIREFLNMVYSSLYMGAGASCSTSVDLVSYCMFHDLNMRQIG